MTDRILVAPLVAALTFVLLPSGSISPGWPHFWPARFHVPAGDRPKHVISEDFNEDGVPDLAFSSYWQNEIGILMGRGDGRFADPEMHSVDNGSGPGPYAIAAGDFDEDHHVDLAVAHGGSHKIAILLGTGAGTFSDAEFYSARETPVDVACGDFNEDGHTDLVVANRNVGEVSILMGNGNGAFVREASISTGEYTQSVAVGDFDGDRHDDLAVANSLDNNVAVLLGSGRGDFSGPDLYPLGWGRVPNAVDIGDFNEDGHPDLAVLCPGWPEIVILLGRGDGSFADANSDVWCPVGGEQIVVADLDEDGHDDLVTTDGRDGEVYVTWGDGRADFYTYDVFRSGNRPLTFAIEDFDGDGHLDLAAANEGGNDIAILLGSGTSELYNAASNPGMDGTKHIAVGDFDEDGHQDMAVAYWGTGNEWYEGPGDVCLYYGNGIGDFSRPQYIAPGDHPSVVLTEDFNEDGHLDLVVLKKDGPYGAGPGLYLFPGTGPGGFADPSYTRMEPAPSDIVTGDFNDDKHLDLAMTRDDFVITLPGRGNGSFSDPVVSGAWDRQKEIAIGDFNEDGRVDLAVQVRIQNPISSFDYHVGILLGDGTGSFTAASLYDAGNNLDRISTGDLNEDSHLDLVVAGYYGAGILLGGGDGTFSKPSFHGPECEHVIAEDIDGDGHQDLIVTETERDRLCVMLGDGQAEFSDPVNYGADYGPIFVATGDFDEDRHIDLAVANGGTYIMDEQGSTVSILLGNWKMLEVELDCLNRAIYQGDTLSYSYSIGNPTDSTVTFDLTLWFRRIGYSGEADFGPVRHVLGAGEEMVEDSSMEVPGNAPLDEYIYTLIARTTSGELLDEDSFRIRIVEPFRPWWPEENLD